MGKNKSTETVSKSKDTVNPTTVKDTFTTPEAAILCGLSIERAKQYARKHGLPRFGKAFVWTKADVDGMRERMRGKV